MFFTLTVAFQRYIAGLYMYKSASASWIMLWPEKKWPGQNLAFLAFLATCYNYEFVAQGGQWCMSEFTYHVFQREPVTITRSPF